MLTQTFASLSRRLRAVRRVEDYAWLRRPAYELPAMLISVGCETYRDPSYDWDGRERPEFALWQYTLAGEGRLTHHGVTHVVRPGTAMLLHFPDDNRYWVPAGGTWEHFWLSLSGREIVPAWKELIARRGGPLVEFAPDSREVQLGAELFERALLGRLRSPEDASAKVYEFAMELLQDPVRNDTDEVSVRIAQAIGFCKLHLGENIGVEDMARAAGYSRHHFTRRFTRLRRQSPHDFLMELRMSTAAARLQSPDARIADVARACGFADPSYFGKVFRRRYGVTPAGFRDSGMSRR